MRHRQGVTGGIPNPAIPIRDHEEHSVAFGRTVGGGGGGSGGGSAGGVSGATLRSLSPVRAFLSTVHRGESVGAHHAQAQQHAAPSRAGWVGGGGGEEEEGGEEADATAALLGGALKDAAARLRHSATLPLTPSGALAALPVSLTRVPGSGARRLDALETAQLLESALAAVDDLGGANRALRARVRELEGEVREAQADAAEEARLRESVLGVGGGGGGGQRAGGGGGGEEQRHQQLLQGSFASRVTATLGGSFAGGRSSSGSGNGGGAGGSAAASSASSASASASASASGAAMAARLLYPPPPPPSARSTSVASHQRQQQQQQQQSHPDLPPFGESGAFPLPFRAPPAAAQRRFPAQGGSGSPVRATPSATAAAAQAQAQFSQAQQYNQPSPPQQQQQQHYYQQQQQQQQQQHPQAPFVSRPSGDSFSGAQSLPARPRRLSVGDAVRAAVGAASMVASR
jgi:hypothetical protein